MESPANSRTVPLDRDARLRRIRFRAWHRGMREVDLLLGRFANTELHALSAADLLDFERLLDAPDRDVLAWATGETPVPAGDDTPLLRRILARRDLSERE